LISYERIGFRDIFNKLKDNYQFIPKIPTCQQLENDGGGKKKKEKKKNTSGKIQKKRKQLTIKQTLNNRLVTKVRIKSLII
jgi:hypothetical protein